MPQQFLFLDLQYSQIGYVLPPILQLLIIVQWDWAQVNTGEGRHVYIFCFQSIG